MEACTYVLQLIDTYAATFSALIVGMAEVCFIAWHYGIDRFLDDIKLMLEHDAPPRWYWRFVWKFFTPVIIVAILVFTLVDFRTLTYGDYTYPLEATIVGFLIALSSVAMVPIMAIYKVFQLDGPILEKIVMTGTK
ncbi:sodium-dependent noradrenaline transporter [Daphnia magna]|uniref:sodium-dependent noradrenaline transporter n=1 Tax=Daphnia magna TaxID=35525 RepID=UPI001E1BAD5B|nr:sodium-dependent noradrenaline transporter [Daphnia magna]